MSGVPVQLDRDEARELAERELSHPRYDSEPPLLQRILEWLGDRLDDLLGAAGGALSGATGVAVLALLVVLVALVVFLRVGPLSRRAAHGKAAVFGRDGRHTAASHRSAAEAAASDGRWTDAVVERYRAVVATLEERSILDPRPGRTAHEAATDAGAQLPDLAAQLSAGADTFDAVHYGGHSATAADDQRLRDLDDAVRRARPRLAVAEQSSPSLAVLS